MSRVLFLRCVLFGMPVASAGCGVVVPTFVGFVPSWTSAMATKVLTKSKARVLRQAKKGYSLRVRQLEGSSTSAAGKIRARVATADR